MTATVTSVIGGGAAEIPGARRMVRAIAARSHHADVADVAELLTDELVTNAVKHGGGRFTLRASVEHRRLRVVVSDPGGSSPVTVLDPGHDHDSGRGLTIVQAMAADWGIERRRSGKRIWFEIELIDDESRRD